MRIRSWLSLRGCLDDAEIGLAMFAQHAHHLACERVIVIGKKLFAVEPLCERKLVFIETNLGIALEFAEEAEEERA